MKFTNGRFHDTGIGRTYSPAENVRNSYISRHHLALPFIPHYQRRVATAKRGRLCRYGTSSWACCDGFKTNRAKGSCEPICENGCVHGECIKPNRCLCQEGWTGSTCEQDFNECALRPCQHRCMNEPGSFRCYCEQGFALQGDNRNCKRDRRCLSKRCSFGCKKKGKKVKCICPAGWKLANDKKNCIDIDECATGRATCPPHLRCKNNMGDYICLCPHGQQFEYNERRKKYQCQIERTCANNPCFEGVTCTPKRKLDFDPRLPVPRNMSLKLYQCGPCPQGYIGNGEVCVERRPVVTTKPPQNYTPENAVTSQFERDDVKAGTIGVVTFPPLPPTPPPPSPLDKDNNASANPPTTSNGNASYANFSIITASSAHRFPPVTKPVPEVLKPTTNPLPITLKTTEKPSFLDDKKQASFTENDAKNNVLKQEGNKEEEGTTQSLQQSLTFYNLQTVTNRDDVENEESEQLLSDQPKPTKYGDRKCVLRENTESIINHIPSVKLEEGENTYKLGFSDKTDETGLAKPVYCTDEKDNKQHEKVLTTKAGFVPQKTDKNKLSREAIPSTPHQNTLQSSASQDGVGAASPPAPPPFDRTTVNPATPTSESFVKADVVQSTQANKKQSKSLETIAASTQYHDTLQTQLSASPKIVGDASPSAPPPFDTSTSNAATTPPASDLVQSTQGRSIKQNTEVHLTRKDLDEQSTVKMEISFSLSQTNASLKSSTASTMSAIYIQSSNTVHESVDDRRNDTSITHSVTIGPPSSVSLSRTATLSISTVGSSTSHKPVKNSSQFTNSGKDTDFLGTSLHPNINSTKATLISKHSPSVQPNTQLDTYSSFSNVTGTLSPKKATSSYVSSKLTPKDGDNEDIKYFTKFSDRFDVITKPTLPAITSPATSVKAESLITTATKTPTSAQTARLTTTLATTPPTSTPVNTEALTTTYSSSLVITPPATTFAVSSTPPTTFPQETIPTSATTPPATKSLLTTTNPSTTHPITTSTPTTAKLQSTTTITSRPPTTTLLTNTIPVTTTLLATVSPPTTTTSKPTTTVTAESTTTSTLETTTLATTTPLTTTTPLSTTTVTPTTTVTTKPPATTTLAVTTLATTTPLTTTTSPSTTTIAPTTTATTESTSTSTVATTTLATTTPLTTTTPARTTIVAPTTTVTTEQPAISTLTTTTLATTKPLTTTTSPSTTTIEPTTTVTTELRGTTIFATTTPTINILLITTKPPTTTTFAPTTTVTTEAPRTTTVATTTPITTTPLTTTTPSRTTIITPITTVITEPPTTTPQTTSTLATTTPMTTTTPPSTTTIVPTTTVTTKPPTTTPQATTTLATTTPMTTTTPPSTTTIVPTTTATTEPPTTTPQATTTLATTTPMTTTTPPSTTSIVPTTTATTEPPTTTPQATTTLAITTPMTTTTPPSTTTIVPTTTATTEPPTTTPQATTTLATTTPMPTTTPPSTTTIVPTTTVTTEPPTTTPLATTIPPTTTPPVPELTVAVIDTTYLASPIDDAEVMIMRYPNGNSHIFSTGRTDSAGTVRLFIPENEHILVMVNKNGYLSSTASFIFRWGTRNLLLFELENERLRKEFTWHSGYPMNQAFTQDSLTYNLDILRGALNVAENQNVLVTVHPVNVSDFSELQRVPELLAFTPTNKGGETHGLEVYGMAEFRASTQTQDDIDVLRPITITIPLTKLPKKLKVRQTLPAWYWDEEFGLWHHDGEGVVKIGSTGEWVWEFETDHFDWWSVGNKYTQTSCVTVRTCYDKKCKKRAPFMPIQIWGLDYSYYSYKITNSEGEACFQYKLKSKVQISSPCSRVVETVASSKKTNKPACCSIDYGRQILKHYGPKKKVKSCKIRVDLQVSDKKMTDACLDPGSVWHAMRHPSSFPVNVGTSIQYSCRSSYRLTGSSRRTCLYCNTWSGIAPTCSSYSSNAGKKR